MCLALISDIHANLPALECVLGQISKQKISRIYCLGDLVGGGPFPGEVLKRLRRQEVRCKRLAGEFENVG